MRTSFAKGTVGLVERVCYLRPVEAELTLKDRTTVTVFDENRKLHRSSLEKLKWKKETVVTS